MKNFLVIMLSAFMLTGCALMPQEPVDPDREYWDAAERRMYEKGWDEDTKYNQLWIYVGAAKEAGCPAADHACARRANAEWHERVSQYRFKLDEDDGRAEAKRRQREDDFVDEIRTYERNQCLNGNGCQFSSRNRILNGR